MIFIAGYKINEVIHKSDRTSVYRGYRQCDRQPVIIKIPRKTSSNYLPHIFRFNHEFAIAKKVVAPGLLKLYEIVTTNQGIPALIVEDFGGESLRQFLAKNQLSCLDFLSLAIQMTESLQPLHQAQIIHQDIHPANILINPIAKTVKITDFGMAVMADHSSSNLGNLSDSHPLSANFAYMSPEQTGRMNRGIDYRTDFYSLGMTFYQMLTGTLPFQANDPLEWIHCHIAKTPPPPEIKNDKIPKTVSQIILKLLAKDAEDRYQSIEGLQADLQNCLAQLVSQGTIANFSLGQQDIYYRFQIPQKVYGRQKELATLMAIFNQVKYVDNSSYNAESPLKAHVNQKYPRGTQIILISGSSGIGKSALVREIHKPIVAQCGYFISGKFDQYQRNIPYSAWVSAVQAFIRQILTESDAKITIWREKILSKLGNHTQMMVKVIPELELIIGKQPPIKPRRVKESENRLHLIFVQLMSVFSQEHPLVIFLDDLQWADTASLKLLELLSSDRPSIIPEVSRQEPVAIAAGQTATLQTTTSSVSGSRLDSTPGNDQGSEGFIPLMGNHLDTPSHLLIIGAYRDRDLCATNAWQLTLDYLKSLSDRVTPIELRPLSIDAIAELMSDTVQSSPEWSQPLAEFLFHKTNGHPFFLKQLLQSLYQQNLLTYNRQTEHWQWDIQQIQAIEITDNLLDFILKKLQNLPLKTLNLLKLAACIGDRFDLESLANINQTSLQVTAQYIQPAIQAELIFLSGDDPSVISWLNNQGFSEKIDDLYFQDSGDSNLKRIHSPWLVYKFIHDRVQQAVYSLISANELAKNHLKIGQTFLQFIQPEERYNQIFKIVNQMNLGISLITDLDQKYELAALNLMAGQKAKYTSAYEAAWQYLRVGLELLTEESWKNHYDLTLVLHIEALETAYLNREYIQVKPLVQILLQQTKTCLEKVKVYELQIKFYMGINEINRSIATGLTALKELNIYLPENPSKIQELREWIVTRRNLHHHKIADLKNLPSMTNPYELAAMRILVNLAAPTAYRNPRLFSLVVLTMVKLGLKSGNSPFAAYGYGIYGAILCASGQDIQSGYELGKLSLTLLEKFDALELNAKVHKIFNAQVRFAEEPLRETIDPLRQTIQWGLETGDFEYVGYAAADYCLHQLFVGENLLFVSQQLRQSIDLLERLTQKLTMPHLQIWRTVSLNLCDESSQSDRLVESRLFEKICHEIDQELPVGVENGAIYTQSVTLAKIMVAYLCNQPEPAMKTIELLASPGLDPDWLKQVQVNFYSSLLLLMQARGLPKKERNQRLKTVAANQKQMKKWASHGASNFQHKYELVAAETARVLGNANKAIAAYDRAIIGATEQGYIHEAAIANHRAGEFYLEQGSQKIAQIYLRDAYEGYLNWGAIALVKQLESQYPQVFCQPETPAITLEPSPSIDPIAIPATPSHLPSLDLNTVIKASQALSNETLLENLLEKFMKMVMENAGATTACFIWHSEGTWAIKARAILNPEQIIIGEDSPVETSEHLPVSLINYVVKTREDLVLNDATIEERFNSDPYIQINQPKSILSMPILHQGNFIGLLYLENNLTTAAFPDQNLEILKLLSSQAALFVENAQLYAHLSIREQRLRRQSSTLLKLSQRNRQEHSRDFRKATPLIQDVFGLPTRNQSENETNQTTSQTQIARSDDLLSSVQEILEASAKTLELERVSVWLYNDQHTRIKCLDLYELSLNRHTCCMELDVCDYPTYFRVLSTERMIAAHDARTDLRTLEFRDNYLIPLGITSMLGAPIRVSGQMVGILCHEHTGVARHWTIEEESFAASLADLVALAVERFYRAKAEQERDRFFSLSQDLLCVIDFQGQFTQLNPAWEKTLAISSEAMLGKSFIQFVHPDDQESTQVATEKLVSRQEIITFENRYQCADGSYRWLFWNATPDLERQLIYAVVHDITYRVEAEAALKQANEELEMRVEERTAELQRAIASLKQTNQQLNDEITFRRTTEEALRYSQEQLKNQTHELQDALDQLQRTQIQLVQNEKMASLGQLVAGIAHEINNPVSFIYSNIDPLTHYIDDLLHLLQLYQKEYPQSNSTLEQEIEAIELEFLIEDIPRLLDSMKSGADRIRKIVLSLRNFSRLDEAAKKRVDIHEGIESTLLILQHQLKDIELIKEFETLPQVECYSAQINQVFMNILANSIDALKQKYRDFQEKPPGNSLPVARSSRITIRTEVTNTESVKITIADNGTGIPENIKNRIFDPFFTTKSVGSGTGLGLSVSYQIVVEKHHGNLSCDSQSGEGTEFVIELPIRLPN